MTQTPRRTIGIGQTISLFVFVATVAIFLGALANAVLAGLHEVQDFAVAFSYLVAVVAEVAMFIDVYDFWVRGRRFNKATARGLRMVVMVAVLASMATTLLGKNMTLVAFLLPSILIYYMTMRPQPATSRAGGPARGGYARGGSARGGASSGGAKARQRRGGRKRR